MTAAARHQNPLHTITWQTYGRLASQSRRQKTASRVTAKLGYSISRLIRFSTQPRAARRTARENHNSAPAAAMVLEQTAHHKRQRWQQPQEDSPWHNPHEGRRRANRKTVQEPGRSSRSRTPMAQQHAGAATTQDGSAGAATRSLSFAQPHMCHRSSRAAFVLDKPRHALAWLSSATDTPHDDRQANRARTMKLRFISILTRKRLAGKLTAQRSQNLVNCFQLGNDTCRRQHSRFM